MFAQALLSLALAAFIVSAIVTAGLVHTRTMMHHISQTYLKQGYERALKALVVSIAAYEENAQFQSPLPQFTPLGRLCVNDANPCRFTTEATIALETPGPAYNQQTNPYVAEDRAAARITVTVRAADGTALAARTSDVTLRRLRSAPYVAIDGTRDETIANVVPPAFIGDDGGMPPATANPCAAVSPGIGDNSVVRVTYQNAQTGACTDGSSWR